MPTFYTRSGPGEKDGRWRVQVRVGVRCTAVPPQVLTLPEVSARLGISRFTVYGRIEAGKLLAFRALYASGPWRFLLGSGGALRPLPHFHHREPAGVPWVRAEEVASTLRVSTRLVRDACRAGVLEAWRSPGARRRARYLIAIDTLTRLPLPAGTLVAPRDR